MLKTVTARIVAPIGDVNADCAPAQLRGVRAVCEKCREIDLQIEYYERLKDQKTDKVFLAGVAEVLQNYLAEKIALHPVAK